MTSHSKYMVVPVEALDKVLFKIYNNAFGKDVEDILKLSQAIARRGKSVIKDKNGNDLKVFRIPVEWYNYIKKMYEMPI